MNDLLTVDQERGDDVADNGIQIDASLFLSETLSAIFGRVVDFRECIFSILK